MVMSFLVANRNWDRSSPGAIGRDQMTVDTDILGSRIVQIECRLRHRPWQVCWRGKIQGSIDYFKSAIPPTYAVLRRRLHRAGCMAIEEIFQ